MAYTPLKESYRKSSPFIATFDWFDVFANAGYKKFYFVGTWDSVGKGYMLSTQALSSSVGNGGSGGIGVGGLTLEFEITFNAPVTIAAEDAWMGYWHASTGPTGSITTEIYHVKGITETLIGTNTSREITGAANWQQRYDIPMTRKRFNAGDKLKIKQIATSGGNSISWNWEATDATYDNGIYIPFEVDV